MTIERQSALYAVSGLSRRRSTFTSSHEIIIIKRSARGIVFVKLAEVITKRRKAERGQS